MRSVRDEKTTAEAESKQQYLIHQMQPKRRTRTSARQIDRAIQKTRRQGDRFGVDHRRRGRKNGFADYGAARFRYDKNADPFTTTTVVPVLGWLAVLIVILLTKILNIMPVAIASRCRLACDGIGVHMVATAPADHMKQHGCKR